MVVTRIAKSWSGSAWCRPHVLSIGLLLMLTLGPAAALGAPSSTSDRYRQTNLVSDVPGLAAHTDPDLVNPWGLASSATSPFWVADNGTGLSTLYNGAGVKSATVVTIQPASPQPPATKGTPTGVVFNPFATSSPTDFVVNGSPARFIFATEDGTIAGWSGGPGAVRVVDNLNLTSGPVYKGLAIGSTGGKNYLYAANFRNGTVDVYDGTFTLTTLAGDFRDTGISASFAPFGIENIGGTIFVTYAKQDSDKEDDVAGRGNGFVDRFNLDGTLAGRFASGDPLNSPWGLAVAPSQFGRFSGDILVGNFGDGRIHAFAPNGTLVGTLKNLQGRDLIIEGLWGLRVGTGGNGFDPQTLYFAAGPDDESHGLFGAIAVAPDLTEALAVTETAPYTAGQTVHYRVTIDNAGGAMSPSDNVFTMIRLPAGAGFSGITGVSGGAPTCTFTSPDVACQHAALAGGGEIVFDVAVVLPTRLPGGGTLQTQAEVDPKNAVPEGDETNNKAQLSIAVQP